MTTNRPCEQIFEYCSYNQFYLNEDYFGGLECEMEEEQDYIDIETAKEEALIIANIICCTCNADYKDDETYYGFYDNDEKIALRAPVEVLEYVYQNI